MLAAVFVVDVLLGAVAPLLASAVGVDLAYAGPRLLVSQVVRYLLGRRLVATLIASHVQVVAKKAKLVELVARPFVRHVTVECLVRTVYPAGAVGALVAAILAPLLGRLVWLLARRLIRRVVLALHVAVVVRRPQPLVHLSVAVLLRVPVCVPSLLIHKAQKVETYEDEFLLSRDGEPLEALKA